MPIKQFIGPKELANIRNNMMRMHRNNTTGGITFFSPTCKPQRFPEKANGHTVWKPVEILLE
jgi:hypothetical protein